MNDTPNRRKDDARPAVALQWGERPDQWTLLLTGPTSGMIGPLGSTWPHQPAELERVDVCVRRKDGPAVVYRTGGEGTATWQQFYPCTSAEPLRDGEMLYREGAVPKLDNIELYRLQMAGISAASLGHWKLGDSIHPDYDTVPLRDVAALYVKYEELFKFRESVRGMVQMLKNREWAEDLGATGDAAELQSVITELVGARLTEPAPDAVDAALVDAIKHGTGAFQVKADGSTEHVELSKEAQRHYAELAAFPPKLQRDALYQDYAVPTKEDPT